MKLANRIGAAVLATAMVGTLLTGCGGGSASTNASAGDGASSTEASGDGDNTYTMFMRSTYVDWIKELKWYDVAEERTGIHVDYISGPEEAADVYSEVDQRVISGDLPDAVMTKLAQTNVYGPQGVFADLAPYIEKYAPNLQKYIDDNPDYKALVSDADGHIYGLCKETPIFADLIGYRVDHFKAAGIDPDSIVTVDDFTKALETLKAYYGKDNPNYYPLTGRDTAIRFASWFGAASNISSTESNGIYINGHYKDGSIDIMNDGAYKMAETMKKWYDEGLIQPEWVAGTFSEADWEAAMLNGNGSVFYDYYNRAEWFMENGGPDNDPNYQMGVLNFIKDDNGNPQKMTVSMKYNDECVTAINANCSEDKIKTILTFIDYFYSEEGEILANYGVEGESFKDTNNNASISAIKLQSGALAIIYNDVSFNEDGSRTVWPDQRCPVAMALSEDGGKTWPWRRIVEHGEGFIGPWNDVNNRRYEYPVMMQSKDGKIHAAYAWGRRVRIKYVCVDEAWIRGAKVCKGAEDNPEMPCNR